ncbi:MAG: FKBP-type peptidyl-prolyl cis-trans isomerase, partial [archaeon]|nr:FKBP-type peptidyl-prolyl cis-trans isomerase [archaeon]
MADAGEKEYIRKEREPITWVCFIIFLIACIAVIGLYVNDNYIKDNSVTVEYGDSIDVEYVGSLYAYYDQSSEAVKPVIFDTNVEKVGNSESYLFTANYSKKTTYKVSTITLGNHDFLETIENALVGHKVGDTVQIFVPGNKAYPAADQNTVMAVGAMTFNNGVIMKLDDINKMFGTSLKDFTGTVTIDSGYTLDDAEKTPVKVDIVKTAQGYTVNYVVANGNAIVLSDSALGKVVATIGSTATSKVEYTVSIENAIPVKDAEGNQKQIKGVNEIEMISAKVFGSTVNFLGYDSTNVVLNHNGI